MKLEYLYAIRQLYNASSMLDAAEKLGINIRTLTKYLNQVESETGITILDKSQKGIVFTGAGYSLYLYAYNIISGLDSYRYHVHAKKEKYLIAAEMKIFLSYVLLCSKSVVDKYQIRFEFKQLYREEVLKGLIDNKYDLGIITMDKSVENSVKDYGLEFVALSNRKTSILVNKNHPLADQDEVALTELTKYKRVSFENPFDDYYSYTYEIDKKYGVSRGDIILKYLGDIVLLLSKSDFYFIGGITSEEEVLLKDLSIIPVKEIKEDVQVGYIYRRNKKPDEVIQMLIDNGYNGVKNKLN